MSGIATSYLLQSLTPLLLASLKVFETRKFWLKSSVLAGIVTK